MNKMSLTFEELKEKMERLDEITLMELLGLTSTDIINRFEDIIEHKQEYIRNELYE